MQQQKFWSRVSGWFKPGGHEEQDHGVHDESPATQTRVADAAARFSGADHPAESQETGGVLTWRRNQTQTLQRLEEGYNRLTKLIDAISNHLEIQDERTQRMADAMSELAGTISQLPETSRQQHQQLSAITQQLESANERFAHVESSLSHMPTFLESQNETLQALQAQLDAASQGQAKVADSVQGFQQAVQSMAEASTSSTAMLKEMRSSAEKRDERMMELLAEHNHKFTRLFVSAIVVAGLMAAATITMALLR